VDTKALKGHKETRGHKEIRGNKAKLELKDHRDCKVKPAREALRVYVALKVRLDFEALPAPWEAGFLLPICIVASPP